jgi:hypothetical protein
MVLGWSAVLRVRMRWTGKRLLVVCSGRLVESSCGTRELRVAEVVH